MTGAPEDHEDFHLLFRSAYRPVLAYALRRVDAHRAHDVAAETFVIAWARRHKMPPADQTTPWLLAIARNVVRNSERSQQRQERVAVKLAGQPTMHAAPADAGDDLQLQQVLKVLAPNDAEILRLAYWDDLDNEQIAKVLNVPKPVVAVRLSRARSRLKAALATRQTARTPSRSTTTATRSAS